MVPKGFETIFLLGLIWANGFSNAATGSEDLKKCRLEVERILSLPPNAGSHLFLRLPESANHEQAKSAYRELAKTLHDDKIRGADSDLQNQAKEAFDKVTKAYRTFEALNLDFERLLDGGFDRTKWSPLFPLKLDKTRGQPEGEMESAFNRHESLARCFVKRGSYPNPNKPESLLGRETPYNGKNFRKLIDVFAQKFLPENSPFFGPSGGRGRRIIGPIFDRNPEFFDSLFRDYIKAQKANSPFVQWSTQSISALEKVNLDDRLGILSWFESVLDDVWTSKWIPTLPVRASSVLMETQGMQAVGARLAIYELARASSYEDFVLKGAHLPIELWRQAQELGLESVRNFNFPVVGASLEAMAFLHDWSEVMQKKAIDEIVIRIESRNSN